MQYVEGEVIAADDIAGRLAKTREAVELIQGILFDLTKGLSNSAEYAADLERLDDIARYL